ncbi:hypothetical protein X801_10566 [Opisthorchis viverrini]|uniref:Uncharacterized protein n=1 Tax=Opisthorchis viverrini TaxID=6198 RepID=A0A1S8WGT8_OPIVI|nr:hypothetical protein X801_10566 [Opisthorchis viverrini]
MVYVNMDVAVASKVTRGMEFTNAVIEICVTMCSVITTVNATWVDANAVKATRVTDTGTVDQEVRVSWIPSKKVETNYNS